MKNGLSCRKTGVQALLAEKRQAIKGKRDKGIPLFQVARFIEIKTFDDVRYRLFAIKYEISYGRTVKP